MLGIVEGGWAPNVPNALMAAASVLGIEFISFDPKSLASSQSKDVLNPEISCIGPTLTYLLPETESMLSAYASAGVKFLNPLHTAALADDKAETFKVLSAARIPQVHTILCEPRLDQVQTSVESVGCPAVVKRAVGGQGRWVRLVQNANECKSVLEEFSREDPSTILVQPFVSESSGKSIRVIVLQDQILASTARKARDGDWISNISNGGSQERYELSDSERNMCLDATKALGLGFAGVDLLISSSGPLVLEVNACPDFTSMRDYTDSDIAKQVVRATISL